jgi:ATP-dependent Clp protease ATP-binding subunit ClpA
VPKINVYLPDDLAEAVKDAGVPVSAVCQRALERAVRRVTAIREIATATSPADVLSDPPAVNFTKRSMSVLQSAQARASAEGAAEIDTGHALRALLVHGDMATEVLAALEITPRQVEAALDKRAPAGDHASAGAATGPAISRQLATAIELAVNESSGLGNGFVGSEHLLLGLIGEPDGVAGSVLRSLGADPRVTRRTVAAALAGWGAGFSAHEQRATEQPAATTPPPAADQLSAAIRAQLEPVLARLDRLERTATS